MRDLISKDKFIEIIKNQQTEREHLDKADEIFPNLWESKLFTYGFELFDKLIISYFDERGSDWIFWWLYEKDGRSDMKAYDENHNEILTETIDDLWELVKQYRI